MSFLRLNFRLKRKDSLVKTIRITLLIMTLLMLAAPAIAETRGWGANLAVYDGEFGLQVRKDFWLGGDISQITGQAGVYFAGNTLWALDVDYHFIHQFR